MAEIGKKKDYLDQVARQIQWERAKGPVLRELADHLEDQQAVLEAAGYTREEAEAAAVREMGDPVPVGKELDRLHRPQYPLGLLVVLPLVLLAGVWVSLLTGGSMESLVQTRLPGLVLGGLCCLGLTFWDSRTLGRHPLAFALALAAFPVLVWNVAWLEMPERMAPALIWVRALGMLQPLASALLIYACRGKGYRGLALCGLGELGLLVLASAVPSVTGLGVFLVSSVLLLLLAIGQGAFRVKRRLAALLVVVPVTGAVVLTALSHWPYFASMLWPQSDPMASGYQGTTIQQIWAGVKPFGPGSLEDPARSLFLPVVRDSSPIAGIAYDYGWVAALGILLLWVLFLVLLVVGCGRQKSLFGRLMASAIGSTLFLQTVGSVLMSCFGIGRPTFVLPLVQEGNAQTVVCLCLVGLFLSLMRQRSLLRDVPGKAVWVWPVQVTWDREAGALTLAVRRDKAQED